LLHDLDPSLAFYPAITEAAHKAFMLPSSGRSERIAYLSLPATWDAWLGSLHRDKRYRIKNIRKKAQPARFFVWTDAATLDQGIDRLIWLHNKRWEQAGQQHAFSTDDYKNFHRALMHALHARDQLRLYALELQGQIAAMYYFYKFRDGVYLMQSGFDPDFGDVKPGQVLLGHIVENAISEGNKVLDFLRGDHRYKDELATGERETVYVTAFRPRPGSLVYLMRRMILPRLKAYVMQRLKKQDG
jgi:CelD/BcsL family acetyltransferase involved in cellulose biosynthesis